MSWFTGATQPAASPLVVSRKLSRCGADEQSACHQMMMQTVLLTAAVALLVFGALALHKQVPGVSIGGAHMFLIVGGVLGIPFAVELGSCAVQRGVPCMTHVCRGKRPPREK